MDYRKMLENQPQDKIMIWEDGKGICYRRLLEMAAEMEKKICTYALKQGKRFDRNFEEENTVHTEKNLYFIAEDTIAEELAAFIACQGSNMVPVILAGDVSENGREKLENGKVPNEAVMGVLTSGTTGEHKILYRTYESWADYFPYQNQVFSMDGNTVLFAQGSLAFTGNMNLYMALFSVGGTVVVTKKFNPRYWLFLIRKYQVNYIYLIPAKMMALCKIIREPCKGVKQFVTGSQSFGKKELQRVKTCFLGVSVVLYYGCSEANYITYLRDWEMTEDNVFVGQPFPKVQVSIHNGIFYVENSYGVIGIEYPFCTKDLGRMDERGGFYFEGRQDDLLNVNGRKCSAYKIGQAVQEKFEVDSIVTVEKEKDRDVLAVYYECETSLPSALQIRKQLQEILEEPEIPKRYIRVDKLPRTDSGKIKKNPYLSLDRKE